MIVQTSLLGEPDLIQDPHTVARDYLESTKGLGSKVVASLSGGKTSSYMALHYPADHYVFALVLTEDKASAPKDPGLTRAVRDRIPQFIASRELDQTLVNMLNLEQELGKEIKWVCGPTFDELIRRHNAVPNKLQRFCTEELKVYPIFWHYYLQHFESFGEMLEMAIGFRYDEAQRVFRALGGVSDRGIWNWDNLGSCEKFKFAERCDLDGRFALKHRWKAIEWRFKQFPLYLDKITHQTVREFWSRKGWVFPEVPNCDFCPFHRPEEQRSQYAQYPERLQWWLGQEQAIGSTFLNGISYQELIHGKATPLDFMPCHCTD